MSDLTPKDILNSPDEFILIVEVPGRTGPSHKAIDLKRGLIATGFQGTDCFLRVLRWIFEGKQSWKTRHQLDQELIDAWVGEVPIMKDGSHPVHAFRVAHGTLSHIQVAKKEDLP